MADLGPKRMGDYEILDVLGAGGMGRVYRVRNTITDRIEAMKVLLPDLQGHDEVAARFLREIKVLAALKHPNIATLHTAQTIDNQLVMIMEYVEGESLAARIAQRPVAVEDALHYIDQVLDALSYAHERQVIHRDIKPANMMLTPDGTIKLMDFGIARTKEGQDKLTQTGSTLGSINYMSPEQVKGGPIDARSDLYSVGISLYEMVTGQKPFHGDSSFSIMSAHLQQTPTPPVDLHPGLPPSLNELILKSIAKAPEDRLQSATAFRAAVRNVLQSLQDAKTIVAGSMAETVGVGPQYRPAVAPITSRTPVPTSTPRAVVAAAGSGSQATMAVASPTSAATAPLHAAPAAGQKYSNRGLYMALGALVVLVALIAAGIYLPGRGKSSASAKQQAVEAQQPSVPATTTTPPPEQQPPVTQQPASTLAESSASQASVAPVPSESAASKATPESSPAQSSASRPHKAGTLAANVPPKNLQSSTQAQSVPLPDQGSEGDAEKPASPEMLDELEKEMDQLQTRIAAVNSALGRLQQEQANSGFSLRGDVVNKQEAMNLNFAKAQNALEHRFPGRAKRFSTIAERNVEALERFLGR